MEYLCIILIGYLFGCSNMAYYLSKLNGIDLKNSGSGNLGASNTLLVLGKKAGAITAVHDILKATIVVLLAGHFYPHIVIGKVLAGASCILGHIFPFYLHFKGGKGFASYIGMCLGLDWKMAIGLIIIIVVVVLITDYIVAGTTSTFIVMPIATAYFQNNIYMGLILCIPSMVMLFKHIENYKRIYHGQEKKVLSSLFTKKEA